MKRRDLIRLSIIAGGAVAVSPLLNYDELQVISKNYLVASNMLGLEGFPRYKVLLT